MNFKRASEGEYVIRLPLIALVDVVLFLLLYFLIAGTIASPESQLSTAITADRRGGGQGSALTAQILRVERGTGGEEAGARFVIGSRVMGDRASLHDVLLSLPKDAGIVIRAADDVTVGAAATALQVARDVGFSKVSYVAGK